MAAHTERLAVLGRVRAAFGARNDVVRLQPPRRAAAEAGAVAADDGEGQLPPFGRRVGVAPEGEIAPKSRQGRRDVPIPAVLRDHLLELRMNGTGDGHVFASNRQVRVQAERAGERWTDAGLERLILHDARHTYASLMIAAGVNAKALSTFMGHANIGITLDLYGHLMPGSEAEAATPTSRVRSEARLPPTLPLTPWRPRRRAMRRPCTTSRSRPVVERDLALAW